MGYIPGNTEGVGEFGGGTVFFPAYAETDRHKHFLHWSGRQENIIMLTSNRWEQTAAIIKIALTPQTGPNFLAGSVFELEGILKKEGLPPSEGARWG